MACCGLLRPPSLRCTTISSYSHPTLFSSLSASANNSSISFFKLNRPCIHSSLNFHAPFPRFRAASPGAPPPQPDEDLVHSAAGLDVKFFRLKDTVQIFFALLFWMSLFFWACVWDDKNDGNPTKGPRFRR